MIKFIDSAGNHRGIEFSKSYNPRYINLTLYADKSLSGNTVQIQREKIEEIIDNLINLKEVINGL